MTAAHATGEPAAVLDRQARPRSPGIADPDRCDDRDPVHGAAQAPRPDDHPGAGHGRVPHGVPGRSGCCCTPSRPRPTGRPAATTSTPPCPPACSTPSGSSSPPPWAATAGSVDLTDGMFRHLVITGRSRLALYLARIPAGLAIIVSLVAIGFTIVCAVCVFAAPIQPQLQRRAACPPACPRAAWRAGPPTTPPTVVCNFNDNGQSGRTSAATTGPAAAGRVVDVRAPRGQPVPATAAQARAAAVDIARQNYSDYKKQFLYPSNSLMIKTGLWLELEAAIGFIVGLGLGSLLGQTNRRSDPDDRARDHPDPDRDPNQDPALHQRPARHRRRRHRTPRTRANSPWPSAAAARTSGSPNPPPQPSASSSPGSSAGPPSAPGE